MTKSINGVTCIGAPHSPVRIREAKEVCRDCAKEYFSGKGYHAINMNNGICYICEEKVENIYMLLKNGKD